MAVLDNTKPHTQRLMVFRAVAKPEALPEEFAPAFKERATTLERDLVDFSTKADSVMTTRTLTREGQLQEMQRLSSNQLAEIQKAHATHRAKLTEQLDAERAKALIQQTSKEDALLKYTRHRDIVDFFNDVDPLTHRQLLDDAVREKDIDFLDALATAPRYFRKFDPTLVAAAREQLAAEANPQIAKLSSLRDAYDRVYQTAATIVKDTAEQAGIRNIG